MCNNGGLRRERETGGHKSRRIEMDEDFFFLLSFFFFYSSPRYNLGSGAQILTVGRNLSDGHWHNASIKRNGDQTALTVDHVTVTRSSRGKEFHFGTLATNSPVYVGGLPAWYGGELTRLALPSVLFEPRYRGDIRNLIYSDAVGQPARQQEMLESQVTFFFSFPTLLYLRPSVRPPAIDWPAPPYGGGSTAPIDPHRRAVATMGNLSTRRIRLRMERRIDRPDGEGRWRSVKLIDNAALAGNPARMQIRCCKRRRMGSRELPAPDVCRSERGQSWVPRVGVA